MGASESTEIHVNFNRENLFYYGGEQVAGTIAFHNSHEKLNVDQIFLEFVGELGYTSQETRRHHEANGRTRTEHYTEYHRLPFMTHRFPVVQPQHGQREVTLYRGQHSWPFEFVLPQCLPPSSVPSTSAYPYVKYFVRIVLDKPWYKPNAKQVYALTIFPRVNILHPSHAHQTLAFANNNRKKVHLQGSLIYPGVVPGQKFPVNISLHNPKRAEIKRVEVSLVQHRQVAQTRQSEVIFRMDLPGLTEFNDNQFFRTFELQMPLSYIAPSYHFTPNCCGRALTIAFQYELIIEVKARGLFTDFKASVPVIVGTEPILDQAPPMEVPAASAPVYTYDEPPPSYESVVAANGKM